VAVLVLDKKHKPLMPCSERRAKRLLTKKRARIHSMYPLVIRLVDRTVQNSVLQPVRLKIDPGSIKTGVAIVRENGEKQTVLSLFEIQHRGRLISETLTARSSMRRRRRSNLRYRAPRFANRARKAGWLAPSLQHRVDAILNWSLRLMRCIPITAITCETVRFDTQKLIDPEIDGVEYQQGTLFGYEIREYLLEKWGRKCAYCNAKDVPLQIDHIEPRSRGGSNKVDNLTLACGTCNIKKGNLSLEQFAPKQALTLRKAPCFRDAASVNSTRTALMHRLKKLSATFESGTGGQTKYNRSRLHVPKTHALDAACTGTFSELYNWQKPTQQIHCTGRGSYQRTRLDRFGFPRGFLTRQKQVHGFQTGDQVIAKVSKGKKIGHYKGRVAVRASGSFNIKTANGVVQGVNWKDCCLVQRSDGYHYPSNSKKITSQEQRFLPVLKDRVSALSTG
jgi:5-methylcytosine-specific restriction endonuclease McrA